MISFNFVIVVAFVVLKDGVESYNNGGRNQINQRGIKCPPLNCRPECRFVDRNGCQYCGQCPNPRYQRVCPPVNCPNHGENLKCGVVTMWNGCKQCICIRVEQQKRIHQPQLLQQRPPNAQNVSPPKCPIPQCSSNCQVITGSDGCDRCKCSSPVNCNWELKCPSNCARNNNGVGGCPQCDCGDIAECPRVPCDLSRCRHVVDAFTGCAVKCECNNIPAPRMSQPVYK